MDKNRTIGWNVRNSWIGKFFYQNRSKSDIEQDWPIWRIGKNRSIGILIKTDKLFKRSSSHSWSPTSNSEIYKYQYKLCSRDVFVIIHMYSSRRLIKPLWDRACLVLFMGIRHEVCVQYRNKFEPTRDGLEKRLDYPPWFHEAAAYRIEYFSPTSMRKSYKFPTKIFWMLFLKAVEKC